MEKRWRQKTLNSQVNVDQFVGRLNVPRSIGYLLLGRGIDTFEKARSFFRPLISELHDPFLMQDMDKAVDRLTAALHQGEKILVYGDYDVDGTTAVTLVFSFLKKMGASCDYYIPDRYNEGYGFSQASVEWAHANGFGLIITLDCGIKDGEKVDLAKKWGIDVIICDHHNPDVLPEALAVLDPKRSDCPYPFKGLSGCGVGFKLLHAFCIQQGIDQQELFQYLDLLVIAIGADIVPISDENRILAHYGLKNLNEEKRPGIAAMLEQAGFKKRELTISDVVFLLAPRINAAGRIFSGRQAVELLLSESLNDARKLSPALEDNNNTRKSLDKEITREALHLVSVDDFYRDSFSTVVCSEGWHKGVLGIVASRLVEAYYKPTVVLVNHEGKLSGSARSIEGIDLFETLGECSDLLDQFGGHAMAAGLSLKPEHFVAFRQRFDKVVKDKLRSVYPVHYIEYDIELHLEEIDARFYTLLRQFAPFGPENMRPVFMIKGVQNARFSRPVGETGSHLKLHVAQKKNLDIQMDGIGFDLGHWFEAITSGAEVDLLCTVEENEWNNKVSLQLNVKDIRLSEKP
jgi:single-stranded-DNA-specific exonuclease